MTLIKKAIITSSGLLITLISFYLDTLRGQVGDELGYFQITGIVFGILITIYGTGFGILKAGERLSEILLFTGLLLLSVNIYGEFRSLRNPTLSEGKPFVDDIIRKPQYTPQEAMALLPKFSNESQEEYADRLTELIYKSTVHYWETTDDLEEYNHILPFYENYLLYFRLWGTPNAKNAHAICDPYQAVERGVVICSQAAQIIVSLWDATETNAHMITLDGHVITEVKISDEKWWVLDPDFGVVIKEDFETIENNPNLAYTYYKEKGYSTETSNKMVARYEKKGNYIITNTGICRSQAQLEKDKWLFPFYATLPFLFIIATKKAYKFYLNRD